MWFYITWVAVHLINSGPWEWNEFHKTETPPEGCKSLWSVAMDETGHPHSAGYFTDACSLAGCSTLEADYVAFTMQETEIHN